MMMISSGLITQTIILVVSTYPLKLLMSRERIVSSYLVSLKSCQTVDIGHIDQSNEYGNVLFLILVYINFLKLGLLLPF